jgi:predicted nucleotidyltransferase
VDERRLAARLAAVPGVVAVTLGGSRARGEETAASDWDFGLYYRGDFDVAGVRALGYAGEVTEPGAWGPIMNGGAWLTVEEERVDLVYRDLDVVEHWVAEAGEGRFEIQLLEGFVAGIATYVLAGELALGRVLVGDLPRPAFADALRRNAPQRWDGSARFSLDLAESAAGRADATSCAGLLAKAAIAAAQARLAERGEWALNEKGIVRRAGLGQAETLLAAVGSRPLDLAHSVTRMRIALGLRGQAA